MTGVDVGNPTGMVTESTTGTVEATTTGEREQGAMTGRNDGGGGGEYCSSELRDLVTICASCRVTIELRRTDRGLL